jgi:hypothetical protein
MPKVLALPLAAIRSSQGAIDGLVQRKREIEEEISPQLEELKTISESLTTLFLKHDLTKVAMPDGTSLSRSVTTTSRVIPEKLLEHKVSMSIIEACTETTTSKPYVRVYYPRANKGESK